MELAVSPELKPLLRLQPPGWSRALKGKVSAKAPWTGWPKTSPDGWWYARQMKHRKKGWKKEGTYETKQAIARRTGTEKGSISRKLQAAVQAEPMSTK